MPSRRLHPWTHDPGSCAMVMRRRGVPGSPERTTWDRVLTVAVELDDIAADPATAPATVPPLAGKVRDLLARLPESGVAPRMVPLVLLDAMDDQATGVASQAALSEWLGDAAVALVGLCGAPVARNPDALAREATDVLKPLGSLLATWTERLAESGIIIAPVVVLPPPLPELDDRY